MEGAPRRGRAAAFVLASFLVEGNGGALVRASRRPDLLSPIQPDAEPADATAIVTAYLLHSSPLSSRYVNELLQKRHLLAALADFARQTSPWIASQGWSDARLWSELITANNASAPLPPPWTSVDACTHEPKCTVTYRCQGWYGVGLYEVLYDDVGLVSAIRSHAHTTGMFFDHARGTEFFPAPPTASNASLTPWPSMMRWSVDTAPPPSGSEACKSSEEAVEQIDGDGTCRGCGRQWVELRGPSFIFTFIETYSRAGSTASAHIVDGGSLYAERQEDDTTQIAALDHCAHNLTNAADAADAAGAVADAGHGQVQSASASATIPHRVSAADTPAHSQTPRMQQLMAAAQPPALVRIGPNCHPEHETYRALWTPSGMARTATLPSHALTDGLSAASAVRATDGHVSVSVDDQEDGTAESSPVSLAIPGTLLVYSLWFAALVLPGVVQRWWHTYKQASDALPPAVKDPEAGQPADTPAEREAVLDNAKFVLLLLVVQSHMLDGSTGDENGPRSIYQASVAQPASGLKGPHAAAWTQVDLVYEIFRFSAMQGFALVSGAVAQGELTTGRATRLFLSVLAPLILFCGATGERLLVPGGYRWYLHALVIWRLGSQMLRGFSPPVVVLLSLLVSLLAPYGFPALEQARTSAWSEASMYRAADFALPQALSFFAFYGIGFALGVRRVSRLVGGAGLLWVRCVALGLLVLLVCLFHVQGFVDFVYTHLADMYEMEGGQRESQRAAYPHAWRWVPRLTSMAFSFVVLFATLGWIPSTPTWYTRSGANSLYAVCAHLRNQPAACSCGHPQR